MNISNWGNNPDASGLNQPPPSKKEVCQRPEGKAFFTHKLAHSCPIGKKYFYRQSRQNITTVKDGGFLNLIKQNLSGVKMLISQMYNILTTNDIKTY